MTTTTENTVTNKELFASLLEDGVEINVGTINKAKQGDGYSLWSIGYLYHDKKEYDKALAWYRLSADKNHSYSQYHIGVMYHNEEGVPANYLLAMEWFIKAARQHHKQACSSIGDLFEKGQGVPVNKYKALEWYCKVRKNAAGVTTLNKQGFHIIKQDENKSMEQLISETEEIMMMQKQRAKNKSNDMINIPNTLPTDPLNNNNSLINGESTVEQENVKIEDEQEKDQLGEDEDDNSTDGSNLDGGKPTCMESDTYALQNINRQKQQELDALKKTLKNYKRETQDMEKVIDVLNQRNFLFAQQLDAKDNAISSPQFLNQLYDKDNEIQFLKQELQTLQAERIQEQQESQEKMDTLNELLRSKRIEIKLLKQNIELTLFKEKYHKRKLESENKRLKIEMKEYDVLIQTANGHRSESDTEFDSYENDDDIFASNKVVDALKINQNGTAVCTIGNKKRRVSSPDSEC